MLPFAVEVLIFVLLCVFVSILITDVCCSLRYGITCVKMPIYCGQCHQETQVSLECFSWGRSWPWSPGCENRAWGQGRWPCPLSYPDLHALLVVSR